MATSRNDRPNHPVQGQLLVPAEAAAFLRVSIDQLYHLTSSKRIPFLKVGGQLRFVQEQLVAVLATPVEPKERQRGRRREGRSGRASRAQGSERRFEFKTPPRKR
jgi:excisionase family DNA binding protein